MKGCQSFPTLSLLLVFVVWGGWLPCPMIADHHGLGCRSLRFAKPVNGFALHDHVIENISLNMSFDDVRFQCRSLCGMESTCVSINIGLPANDGVSLCQLSNSDDIRHPKDLKLQQGFLYWATGNPCSSDPCLHNATCLNGFTDKRYICLCQVGYTGEHCETGFHVVFTNLGATGRFGPTSLGSYYTSQDRDCQVTLLNGSQQWTVPYTGQYRIEAIAAAGGYDIENNSAHYRGRGARMIGTFNLSKHENIKILVGQEGGVNRKSYGSGGGGGTFIVRGSKIPLLIAGGGGGIQKVESRHEGCDASTNTTGNTRKNSWPGGNNGHGAKSSKFGFAGGGGGGFYSSGRSGRQFNGTKGYGGEGGTGFLQGGVGGRALRNKANGGFGGGGGATGDFARGGGGGGGYSGGSSGVKGYDSCGGGGGSYNAGGDQQNECCYNTAGHGRVTITFLKSY